MDERGLQFCESETLEGEKMTDHQIYVVGYPLAIAVFVAALMFIVIPRSGRKK